MLTRLFQSLMSQHASAGYWTSSSYSQLCSRQPPCCCNTEAETACGRMLLHVSCTDASFLTGQAFKGMCDGALTEFKASRRRCL